MLTRYNIVVMSLLAWLHFFFHCQWEKNVSYSGCIGRSLDHVQCYKRRHWFKVPDCSVPQFSEAIYKLYYISLCCANTQAPGTQEQCLTFFCSWHKLFLCMLSCINVFIESGLQRQTECGGWLAVGAVIQQLACSYSQWTNHGLISDQPFSHEGGVHLFRKLLKNLSG